MENTTHKGLALNASHYDRECFLRDNPAAPYYAVSRINPRWGQYGHARHATPEQAREEARHAVRSGDCDGASIVEIRALPEGRFSHAVVETVSRGT